MMAKTKKRYSLLFEYIYNRKIIFYTLLYGIIIGLSIIEPILAKYVTKFSVYSFDIHGVLYCSAIWLSVFVLRLLLQQKRTIMDIRYDIKIKTECQKRILEKLLYLKYDLFIKESDGFWISRCTDDVNNLDSFMPKVVIGSIWSLVQFVVIGIIMIHMNVTLTMASMVFVIGDAVANFIFPLTKYYRDYAQKRVQIPQCLSDILKNEQLVKCSNIQEHEVTEFAKVLERVYQSFFVREKYNGLRNWGREIVSGLSTPILYLIGGIAMINAKLGMDTMVSFMLYFGMLKTSFASVSTVFIRIRNSNVYIDRINELLDMEEENLINSYKIAQINNITLDKACLKIEGTDVLNELTLNIHSKDKVAIIGASGSGKSSLIKVLLGLMELTSGRVLLNDAEIGKYGVKEVRSKIAYVSQDDNLFNRSIIENIDLWKNGKDVQQALDLTLCNEFLNSSRDLKTTIDGHSNNFSGGEKQRLCIARQLMRDADLFVFDEATSALDKETEIKVFDNIMNFLNDKGIVFITHNPELIKRFKKIIFISNGHLISVGTHDELMSKYDEYRNIYNSYIVMEH